MINLQTKLSLLTNVIFGLIMVFAIIGYFFNVEQAFISHTIIVMTWVSLRVLLTALESWELYDIIRGSEKSLKDKDK